MKKNNFVLLVSGVLVTVTQLANAAVDPAVTTAITTMATDAATVAAAVLVAIIGVVAIKFIRKGL
ncbi:MAG: major capsid protein [Candidatus Nitrotoga sp.]